MGKKSSFATFVWIFIILLAAGAALYWLLPIKKELRSKQTDLQEAKDKLHQLRKEQNAMEQKNHALKTSPAAVEKVAREEFKMVRKDESVIYYSKDAEKKWNERIDAEQKLKK
ncbi:MAG: hypothetical protein E7054_10625 [Lentisphaerae bacterium]|nr:hypothetical protein [Lentisphaerota bacterium]